MNLETVDAAARTLALNMAKLPASKTSFATDLLKAYRNGRFSEKQAEWIGKLADLTQASAKVAAPAPQVTGLGAIVERFDGAVAKGLLYPKIAFGAEGTGLGFKLVLNRAGEAAKVPGSVNLTNGARFGDPSGKWYGRIGRDGTFTAGRDAPEGLLAFLAKLAAGTADVASMYGHETGICCFCGRELTDARSVKVGYGPICADHWGLAWGV